MTELPTESTAGANKDHNVGDLKKLISDCARQMDEIDDERAELNERAGDIRERLRNSGVQVPAFNFARKLKKMEAEARNEYLDSLRVNMEGMAIGGQGEMFVGDNGAEQTEAAHDVEAPEDQTTH